MLGDESHPTDQSLCLIQSVRHTEARYSAVPGETLTVWHMVLAPHGYADIWVSKGGPFGAAMMRTSLVVKIHHAYIQMLCLEFNRSSFCLQDYYLWPPKTGSP